MIQRIPSDCCQKIAQDFLRPEDAFMLTTVNKATWQLIKPLMPQIIRTNDCPMAGDKVLFRWTPDNRLIHDWEKGSTWFGIISSMRPDSCTIEYKFGNNQCKTTRKLQYVKRLRQFADEIRIPIYLKTKSQFIIKCPACHSIHRHGRGLGPRTPDCSGLFRKGYYLVDEK